MHNGDPEILSKIKNMVEEPIIARCKWTDCDIEMDQRKIGDHILAHQRKEKQYDIISRPGMNLSSDGSGTQNPGFGSAVEIGEMGLKFNAN